MVAILLIVQKSIRSLGSHFRDHGNYKFKVYFSTIFSNIDLINPKKLKGSPAW